jgi:hypothetical protein
MAAKIADLLNRDGHIWDSNSNFKPPLSAILFIGDFSNPTHKKIKSFFGRFGFATYHAELAKYLRADFLPCKNMVDQVIDQRNRIAHGDTVTTGTPSDLAQMMRLVKQNSQGADCVVADWFSSLHCPLR